MDTATIGRHARDPRLVGAAMAIAALACFAGLDTGTKAIGALPVALVMWFRYAVQTALTAATQLPRHGRALFATRHPWLQALRGALLLLTSVAVYLSLRVMAVGELTAIAMLTPIVLTIVSAFAFGERVSVARWCLIVLAFGGALLVVQPGSAGFGAAMLLPLLALAANTAFHLVTSRLAKVDDVGTMQFYTGLTGMLIATVALPFVRVPEASWGAWATLALICVLSTLGHGLLIAAYARAGIAALTPLLFGQIAFGTLFGWLFFGHVPNAWALLGICAIMGAGATCMALSAREKPARDVRRAARAADGGGSGLQA
jgi:drug/metabolite transporter (DMT)-like permease